MSLYWLEPGWKDATCPHCGVNIWASGGDPDWGECYECKSARHAQEQPPHNEPGMCDICGEYQPCANSNGYAVCSEECCHVAQNREPQP